MRMWIFVAFLLLLCVSASVAGEEAAAKTPVELGLVPWGRDFHAALKRAKAV